LLLRYQGFDVEWLGHASVSVSDDGFSVVVDPFSGVGEVSEADIVLVTHSDEGHFDEEALESVESDRTVFICPSSMSSVPFDDVEFLDEGEAIDVYGVEIEAVAMKNALRQHDAGVGYRFRMGDTSFYVAGDTGLTEDMRDLEDRVDVAFLPVEGEYTMSVKDAVKAAVRIKPDLAIPYHFGPPFFPETGQKAKEFKAQVTDRSIGCEILEED
jgi:L-ascorbate metabolism protein UlaG (beta-lactamase superfamily)